MRLERAQNLSIGLNSELYAALNTNLTLLYSVYSLTLRLRWTLRLSRNTWITRSFAYLRLSSMRNSINLSALTEYWCIVNAYIIPSTSKPPVIAMALKPIFDLKTSGAFLRALAQTLQLCKRLVNTASSTNIIVSFASIKQSNSLKAVILSVFYFMICFSVR